MKRTRGQAEDASEGECEEAGGHSDKSDEIPPSKARPKKKKMALASEKECEEAGGHSDQSDEIPPSKARSKKKKMAIESESDSDSPLSLKKKKTKKTTKTKKVIDDKSGPEAEEDASPAKKVFCLYIYLFIIYLTRNLSNYLSNYLTIYLTIQLSNSPAEEEGLRTLNTSWNLSI